MKSGNEILIKTTSMKLFMLRRVLKVSQQQIADYAGVSISQYSRWENGKTSPDILSLKAIVSDYFHIPLDDFLNENISPEAHIDIWQIEGYTFPLTTKQNQHCNNVKKAKEIIKNRLPLLRKMSGFSPKALADRLNVKTSKYYCWESGKNLPDTIMLKTIVTDICYYSLDDFLDLTLPIEKLKSFQNDAEAREKTLKNLVRDRLPELREKSQISQNEMAKYLGVSKDLYIDWENGKTLIDVLSLKKIVVDVFHIPLEDFLNDDDTPVKKTLTSQFENGLTPVLLNTQERDFIRRYFRW